MGTLDLTPAAVLWPQGQTLVLASIGKSNLRRRLLSYLPDESPPPLVLDESKRPVDQ